MLRMKDTRIVLTCIFASALWILASFGQTIGPCPAEVEIGQNLTLTCRGLAAGQSVRWQYSKNGNQNDVGTCAALPSLNPCTSSLPRYMHVSRPSDDTSVLTVASVTSALYDGAVFTCAALHDSALAGTADCQTKVLPKTADVTLTCPTTWTEGKTEVLGCVVKASRFTRTVCSGHLADNIDFKFRPSGSEFWINQCQVHIQSGRCDGKFAADGCRCRELSDGLYMLEMIVAADRSRLEGGSWNCTPACVDQSLQNPLSQEVSHGCSPVSFEKPTSASAATTGQVTKRSTTTSTRMPTTTTTRRRSDPQTTAETTTLTRRSSSGSDHVRQLTTWKMAALVIITWTLPPRFVN